MRKTERSEETFPRRGRHCPLVNIILLIDYIQVPKLAASNSSEVSTWIIKPNPDPAEYGSLYVTSAKSSLRGKDRYWFFQSLLLSIR